uniref:Uncharacterized protein n=1 Tax=Nannospalax galili TaxID=1026970 RepID=A0A8C6QT82_NANGA
TKLDILGVDRFIVCDSELSLYHVECAVNSKFKAGSLSTLLLINSVIPYMKCVAWYLNYDSECLLAVGRKKWSSCEKNFFQNMHDNSLAWNPLDSNWLTAGLDKHRTDFSVLIRDICKVRISAGEKILLSGMHCNLAIFDLWNTSQRLTVDPYFYEHVAFFYEGQVAIWDLRKFEKPSLTKVAWCPTRTGLLATLTGDSNIIRMYDMQHIATPTGDETEPTIIERSVWPCDNYIASFAWMSLAWSPITSLTCACGHHLYECAEEESDNSLEKHIAMKMRLQALSRYGLDSEQMWRNHILAGNEDPQLKSLWYILHFIKQYTGNMDQKSPGNKGSLVYAGIKSIVKSSLGMVESSRHNWKNFSFTTLWGDKERNRYRCVAILNSLVQEGGWERPAAVALFNLDTCWAIQIPIEGASSEKGYLNLNVVAMKNSLWRETCSTPRLQLNDCYLCIMFAFLTSKDGVLYENKVTVCDRMAFLTNEMKDARNLEGILLTGLTKDGVDLMVTLVDRTGDVQTASYCTLLGSPLVVLKEYLKRVQYWIENYRNVLVAWRFWHKRAEFDVDRSKLDPSAKPLAQVFVSSKFCGKSISYSCSSVPYQGRGFSQYGMGGSPTKLKVTSCPGYRNPFLRLSWGSKSDEKLDLSKDKKLAQFNNWFTWCHNYRHGGHARHMLSWFRDHAECPGSICMCKCMQLDTTGNLVPKTIHQP